MYSPRTVRRICILTLGEYKGLKPALFVRYILQGLPSLQAKRNGVLIQQQASAVSNYSFIHCYILQDLNTNESGLLQVTLEGIGLKFVKRRVS